MQFNRIRMKRPCSHNLPSHPIGPDTKPKVELIVNNALPRLTTVNLFNIIIKMSEVSMEKSIDVMQWSISSCTALLRFDIEKLRICFCQSHYLQTGITVLLVISMDSLNYCPPANEYKKNLRAIVRIPAGLSAVLRSYPIKLPKNTAINKWRPLRQSTLEKYSSFASRRELHFEYT